MEFGTGDLRELAKLLQANEDDALNESDSDEELAAKRALTKIGPGSLGPSKKVEIVGDQKSEFDVGKSSKDIWNPEEAQTTSKVVTSSIDNDPRCTPAFETFYRQAVSTEDMFLQMGMKTPCTASCENLVLEIALPGEKFQQVKLDVKPDYVLLRSPKYILRFATPHPVDPNGGSAKWDHDKEKLTVTLKLVREYDALNF